MAKIHVPYSKTGMDLNIEDKNLLKVLTSKAHDFKPSKSESQLVEDSMDNPIGSKKLEELAVGKKNMPAPAVRRDEGGKIQFPYQKQP